ncbi:DGQHR domain-containing protein [Arthrospiribacter ruber]|uniref:DGQHR domain-containing protein n=1 Tax=Arthrospiribacter ruber TaxID=2487934 RepID=UPI001FE903D2|nr:DGQHR domain-containing protein [Arthrospiribacter ruber]
MEIIDKQYVEFQCLEAEQPIGNMYIGILDSDVLEYISYADVRRIELGKDNRDVEDYIGIQRELNPNREKEIGKYVNLIDATFPNSIILAISSDYAEYNPDTKMMKILYKDDIAKVLDGQHRIAGLRHYEKEARTFQCIVTIYIDMELEDQAIVFATINKEQKNVSNSLVADLYSFAESRSPQKSAHNIVRALNAKEGSPFYKRIKILGNARNKELETITQDTFVKNIINYISKDPQSDRDFYKRHKSKKLEYVRGNELNRYFLRNIFIDDTEDYIIAQIIWNFFHAVQNKWPNAWNEITPNIILNRSTGFIALMRFFKHAYLSFNKIGEIITKEQFAEIFDKIDIKEEDLNKEKYVPGSSGQGQLYRDLIEKSGLQ